MGKRRGWQVRRPRARTTPPAIESASMILPGSPRVGALDALLREVDSLRLCLETDLSFAASAVEAGAPGLAADILEDDRTSLAAFEHRSLQHLTTLADPPDDVPLVARQRRARVAATPFVAAAALVGFLVGVAPTILPDRPDVTTSSVAATSSLEELKNLVETGSTSQVREAAEALHEQLLAVVAQAGSDPAAARQALLLLSYERDAIFRGGDSDELHDVLTQSVVLANKIRMALPATVRSTVPRVPMIAAPAPSPSAAPKPSPTASPKPKPSPTASPTPSAAPKPKPSPSSSPSAGSGVLTDNKSPSVAH